MRLDYKQRPTFLFPLLSVLSLPLQIFQKDEPQHALMYLYKVENVLFLAVLLHNMTLGCLYF